MKGLIERIAGMPVAVKLLLGLGLIAVIAVAAILLLGLGPLATIVLVAGLLVVGVILVVFLVVLAAIRRRKAAPFEAELAANTGAVPEGISEAAARARLDDLRGRFTEGVETFKKHGKDMYSLPWYAIVGEPGSGKTEVLRHSNIGFPPGLTDELQGSGGTINMDWWFTNSAVILDTAGRLMFEDAAASSNSEWAEFLKLLARHRPNCPINGLMLVIPADSLIKDTADEIDDKARRIARQLDLIQRSLDVRFPVFILITKSDLINGFREFFDGLDDPQLQHQILGWSNPQDLDTPFDPTLVQEHLLNIEDRLLRRRLGLLVDPVAREGANARRLDEVDAMFALPEAMVGVAPRLRRYLEHIFPAGEWSAKPLFLRGMYFVSSMRDGSALDAELAEAMGVSLEQLPEGRVWERDRSYFLKDLFLDKMFREKGLVTRASNTRELRRKRRMALFGATGLASAALIAISVLQASALRRSVAQPRNFWTAVGDIYGAQASYPTIVGGASGRAADTELLYLGDKPADAGGRLKSDGEPLSVARAAEAIAAEVEREIRVPFIFRPAMLFAGGGTELLGQGRREAGRAAIERSVLEPIVRRASASLAASAPDPREREAAVEAWITLAGMLQAAGDTGRELPSLGPLLRWTLRPSVVQAGDWTAYEAAATSVVSLDRALDALASGSDGRRWLGRALRAAPMTVTSDLNVAAGHLEASWLAEFEGTGESPLAVARRIGRSLQAFEQAEITVLDRYAPVGVEGARDDLATWDEAMEPLAANAATLRETLPGLGSEAYADFAARAASRGLDTSVAEVDQMLAVLPSGVEAPLASVDEAVPEGEDATEELAGPAPAALARADDDALLVLRTRLDSARAAIVARAATNEQEVSEFIELAPMLKLAAGRRAFDVRQQMYAAAHTLRGEAEELDRFADLPARLSELRTAVAQQKQINESTGVGADEDPVVRASVASNHVLDRIEVLRRDGLVRLAVERTDAPRSADDVATLVEDLATERGERDVFPEIPLTELPGRRGAFSAEFDRRSGPAVASALLDVERVLKDMPGASATDAAERIREALEDWVLEYAVYWGDMLTVREHLQPFNSWAEVVQALQSFKVQDVNDGLEDLLEIRRNAIDRLPPATEAAWSETVTETLDDIIEQLAAMDEEFDRRSPLPDDVRGWARSWQQLGRDAQVARSRLLRMNGFVFNNDFLKLVGRRKTERVDYYRLFTVVALERLGQDTVAASVNARRLLNEETFFPLRRLPESAKLEELQSARDSVTRQLSTQEYVAAVQAMALVQPGGGGGSGGFPAGSVGLVENGIPFTTGFADVDQAIADLRGTTPIGADEDLALMARVLEALPSDPERPLQCTLELRGLESPESALVAGDRFPEIRMLVNGESTGDFRDIRQATLLFGEVNYPGDAIGFELARTEGGTGRRIHRELVAGPWTPLAILHRYADTASTSDGGTTWDVEFAFDDSTADGGRRLRFAFVLRLSFDRPVPNPSEWPQ